MGNMGNLVLSARNGRPGMTRVRWGMGHGHEQAGLADTMKATAVRNWVICGAGLCLGSVDTDDNARGRGAR
jgi:hypothetical protein